MKSRIAIVILNYINYEDTIACVNCALNQTYEAYNIIIVDNGSPNQSYRILSFIFNDCPGVTILHSKKNLGFARGNNLGIKYAKAKLRADYVFVCNSDILFEENLLEMIEKVDCKGIGVITPTVYNRNQEPQPLTISTDNIYKKALLTAVFILLSWISSPFLSLLYRFIKIKKGLLLQDSENRSRGRYVLQGCSYFLTPDFFRYYNQLYPKTFLYMEEINLLVYLEKVKLSSVVVDTSPVIHKEKGSTSLAYQFQFDRKKLELCTISMLKSLPMYFMNYAAILNRYHGPH